ncbi:MAG: hypothetical protein ACLTTU_12790 [Bilophila wadsworthia]
MRCGRTRGGPGIPYRRIPQALARPEYHWASITMFPVAQPDGGDEIYLASSWISGQSRRRKSLSRTSSLSASA